MWIILDDHGNPDWDHPRHIMEWLDWYSTHKDLADIGETIIGDCLVSTKFFGCCATFDSATTRMHLWETMIIGGKFDRASWRYCDRDAAVQGHTRIVQILQAKQPDASELFSRTPIERSRHGVL